MFTSYINFYSFYFSRHQSFFLVRGLGACGCYAVATFKKLPKSSTTFLIPDPLLLEINDVPVDQGSAISWQADFSGWTFQRHTTRQLIPDP